MAYLLQTITRLVQVADQDAAAYMAAGYAAATDQDVAEHLGHDLYGGTQGVPSAPPLPEPPMVIETPAVSQTTPVVAQVTPVVEEG